MPITKHHPNGAPSHFDDARVTNLIVRYQEAGDQEALAGAITSAQERIKTLIRFYGSARFASEAELVADANWKLLRGIHHFDPAKGSAFCWVSAVTLNAIRSVVTRERNRSSKIVELDETITGKLSTNGDAHGQEAVDDVAHRIRSGARTTVSDPAELETLRWFITSFLAGAFELRRHQCAGAAEAVYGLSPSRARELHDLALLECRRVMFNSWPSRQPIAAERLRGTREAWMERYAPLLSRDEFTKFFVLTRSLSPFVILLVNPTSQSRRLDRNPSIGRQNILWVLNGHPDAQPLFK